MTNALQLTPEQIRQYQRDGAILVRGALATAEMALLEQGLEESYTNPGKRTTKASDNSGAGETFLASFPHLESPSLKALLGTGTIAELAGRMMMADSAQLILDQIFYKGRGHIIPTPWHQDTPYLRVRGDDMIRVWLTADPSPRDLTLKIVRGSHRWNVVYDPRLGAGRDGHIRKTGDGKMIQMKGGEIAGPTVPDIDQYSDSFDILSWDVQPGDALVFNGNMLHAAGGADDYPQRRRAYTTMWGGPNLNYIAPPDNALPTLAEVNRIHVPPNSRLGDCPDAFPIGWHRP